MAQTITTIQIGPIPYKVVAIKRLYSSDHTPLMGEIDYSACIIKLEADQAPPMVAVTLWHELIHAILYGAGFTSHDEQVVDAIAHGIVDALGRNYDLHRLEELWPR